VVGVGGAGKTELLEAVAAALAERGVGAVRVEGRSAAVGSGPSLVAELAGTLGVPGGPDVARSLLGALVERNAALLVDDAHLLDAQSAEALARLWALAPERRLALVVARRPGPRSPGLAHLEEAAAGDERLWLAPLDAAAVAERVAARTGRGIG